MRGDEALPLTSLRHSACLQRVFTRWCNVQLLDNNKQIDDLIGDMREGALLVALVQALTGERLVGAIEEPATAADSTANVQIALNALAADGVEFEGIEARRIQQGDVLQILRLLWIIILRYQVTLWDEQGLTEKDPVGSLLTWLKDNVRDIDTRCLTAGWGDGKLLTLLVNAVAPGLCPGGQQAHPDNGIMFLERAMDRAEHWLGVPQVLVPAELHDSAELDIHSLLTYLSLFRHAELLKDGAPLCFPDKSFALGAGITGENVIPEFITSFDIDCRRSGLGDLIVKISVDGNKVPYKVNVNGGVVNISYIPPTPGLYTVEILLEHEPMPGFPKTYKLEPVKASPAHHVKLSGSGLETGLVSGQETSFTMSYDKSLISPGLLSVNIQDENSIEFKEHVITHQGGSSLLQYTPPCNSIFEINVFYAGVVVPGCPVYVTVLPDMQQILITDLPSHLIPGIPGSFFIRNISTAGKGKLRIKVHPEDRPALPIQVKDVEAGVVQVFCTPLHTVPHKITVSLSGTKKEPVTLPCYPCIDNIKVTNISPEFTLNEKVKFNVDCTRAGIGELFVNILDPTMSSIDEAELLLLSDEYFEVSYIPRISGVFSIFISYDSVPLEDMPMQHEVLAPVVEEEKEEAVSDEPKSDRPICDVTIEPSQLLPIRPGHPHSVRIELKELREPPSSPLEVSITKQDGVAVTCQLEHVSDYVYTAHFCLPTVGDYAISAVLHDTLLPGFPYQISAIPDLNNIVFESDISAVTHSTNTPFSLFINTVQAGIAELECRVQDPAGQVLPEACCTAVEMYRYHITFTPLTAGQYKLTLVYGGHVLPNMPLSVSVLEDKLAVLRAVGQGVSPNQYCSTEHSIITVSAPVSDPGTGSVSADVVWEELEVSVQGGDEVSIPVETKETDTSLVASYKSMIPGRYLISILYKKSHIRGSPFTSNVVPNIRNARFHPGNMATVSVGEQVIFHVDCTAVGAGVFICSVFPPSGKSFTPDINQCKDLIFDVSFTAKYEGQYGIELTHCGIYLPMSPYIFKPTKDKRELKVVGLSKNHKVRPGDTVSFGIDTSQFNEGYPEVYLTDSQNKNIVNYTVSQEQETLYKVSFQPTEVETYNIIVKKEGRLATDSPYTLVSAVNTSKCTVSGKGATDGVLVAGVLAQFDVNFSEAGVGELKVEILDPESHPVEHKVDISEQIASVTYTPPVAGTYTIYVRYCDTLLPPSPFQISVLPFVENCSKIQVKQQCEEVLRTGDKIGFTVDVSKHAEPGSIDVLAEVVGREVDLEPVIEYCQGIFNISIPTGVSGEYIVFIKYNRKDVPGSPFHLFAKSNTTKITATGAGVESAQVPSKQPANFVIHLNGEKPSNIVVNVIDPYGYYVDEVTSKAAFATVDVQYLPMKTGLYNVEILCDDEHISGSPFSVSVEEMFDKSQLRISGNMTEKNVFQFQEEAVLVVDYTAAGDGEIETCIKETNNGTMFQPNITEVDKKKLCIGFPTYQAGNFEVTILYNKMHVPYSPFNYLVISKGSENVQIEEAIDFNVRVHETLRIPVNTKNAGIGKLSSKCHHVRSKTSCKLQTVPKTDGNHDIIFQAPQPGEYLLHVYFNNDEVPNSPVMVIAKSHSEAECYQLDPACSVGARGEMRFTIHGKESNNLVVRCLDSAGEPTPYTLDYTQNNKYSLEILPDSQDRYQLEVYFSGFLISGCPKSFTAERTQSVEYTSVVVPDLDNIELNVNQSVTFPIKIIGPDDSDVSISCTDPHGQELDLEIYKEKGSALITFRPLKSGVHEMSVMLNGAHVAGSPFKLHVSKPDGAKSCTVKQEGIINGVVKLKVLKKCEGTLQVSGIGPGDNEIPLKVINISKEIACIDFTPTDLGLHTIDILVDGAFIRGSPIEIDVQTLDPIVGDVDIVENDSSECDSVASLQKAIVYLQLPESIPTNFDIKCLDRYGKEVVVEKIKSDMKSVTVRFQPTERGNYVITLHNDNVPIYSYSVFVQEITSQESAAYAANSDLRAKTETPEVINTFALVSGEKIRKPVYIGASEPTTFILKDWTGSSIPHIRILNIATKQPLPHSLCENEDKSYSITCAPQQAGSHKIDIVSDGKPLPGTPIYFDSLNVQGAGGIELTGPGVKSPLLVMQRTEFYINARDSGPGTIEVTVCNAYGYLPVEIVDHDDYTYTVNYQPITIGDYTVEVLFNGHSAPNTPAKVKVLSSLPKAKPEPKIKRRVKRKDEPIFSNAIEMTEFIVVYETKNPIKFKILNVTVDEVVKYKARRHRDGTFSLICRPTKAGSHVIKVYEDGKLITPSPYKFHVTDSKGTSGVLVRGAGITDGIVVNKETCFTIDTNQAGPGVLEVAVMQGKSPVQVSVSSKSDYIFTCKYVPVSAKPMRISVLFDKHHVTGSPWKLNSLECPVKQELEKEEEEEDVSERSVVSIPIISKAAFATIRNKEHSANTETFDSSSSLPTLSFSLPIKVSMEPGRKYIKLLLPINDLPALSNPRVYHITSNTKIPGAIVFSKHGYVLKCCPSLYGKYKVNVFDRSVNSAEPLVFFYFNFVESIRPSTAKLYALRSIHPTDYFPIEAGSIQPTEIELACRRLRTPVLQNSMCVFILYKSLLDSPANVTIANKTTNQYIYTKTVMREDENPGIMCYPTCPGDYLITIYPTSLDAIELKFEFTVISRIAATVHAAVHRHVALDPVDEVPARLPRPNLRQIPVHRGPGAGIITRDTVVEVRNMRTGIQVPASIKTQPSGEYTIQCVPTEPGRYIVNMSVNGNPVAGSPMFFTIQDPAPVPHYQAKYDISGQVGHCRQEITYTPAGNLTGEPFKLPNSDVNSPYTDNIKPCKNVSKTVSEKKPDYCSTTVPAPVPVEEDSGDEASISDNTPTQLLHPGLDHVRSDHPVKIILPYFPERARISVFNETSGKVITSDVTRSETGTLVLDCHVIEEGRHRVDVYVDGKLASCGPLYFDVSSWDSETLGIPFTGETDIDNEFFEPYVVNPAFDANAVIYEDFTVGFVFEDDGQVPVSLSSFSEGEETSSSDEEHDRQEIRIQSSLELEALRVAVINENTGESLRARLIERNGDYVVRCRPTVPGHYRVNVRDGRDDVEGSPFFFDVLPQQQSSGSPVRHTSSEHHSPVQRSTDSSTKVSSRREIYFLNPGQCDFERTFSSVGEAEIVFCATSLTNPKTTLTIEGLEVSVGTHLVNNQDGTYTLRFTPPRSGRYKLEVWDDHHVLPGSPFYFDVNETNTKSAADNTVFVTQKGQMCVGNKSEYFCFKLNSSEPLDVVITSQKTGEKISYKLINEDSDFSTIICKPYDTGQYVVVVRNRNTNMDLPISPFYFMVPEPHVPKDKLPRSISPVDGIRHEHLTIKSSSLKTNTSGLIFISSTPSHYLTSRSGTPKFIIPGHTQPDITIRDMLTNEEVLFTVRGYEPGSYLVEVPNTNPGKYQVVATIHKYPVPGTPFTFQIPDTSSATTEIVSTSGIFELQNIDECIRRGDPIVLTIVAEEHPITRVTNMQTRETIHVDVLQVDQTTYTITFCPFKSGRHEVMIKCQGIQVAGSPFYLDVDALAVQHTGGSIQSLDVPSLPSSRPRSPDHKPLFPTSGKHTTNISSTKHTTNIASSSNVMSRYTTRNQFVGTSSSSDSSFSSTEFDDTTSTIFSDFTDTTHKQHDDSSSSSESSVSGNKAVFIGADQQTTTRSNTTRKNIDFRKLSVQKQLKSKMKEDATFLRHNENFTNTNANFNTTNVDVNRNFFTQENSTTNTTTNTTNNTSHKTNTVHNTRDCTHVIDDHVTNVDRTHVTNVDFDSGSRPSGIMSSPEVSDEETVIDPAEHRHTSTSVLEMGQTVCIKIESSSYETVVKNLTYNYHIKHRKVTQGIGSHYIRFKPLLDGKYKVDCRDKVGSVTNFPLMLSVRSARSDLVKDIDPSGFIPKLYVSDVVKLQVFARSIPKCRVEFMNRKLKMYSCVVDQGMDKYLLCFSPVFAGKYKINASDISGHLAFSPLTIDVFEQESSQRVTPRPYQDTTSRTRTFQRIFIKSHRGQESPISVGREINVSISESSITSTFVSVKNVETQQQVPFTFDNEHGDKIIRFSPESKGGYAVSVVGEHGHLSYSPIILYVEDDISPDWRIYLNQLRSRYSRNPLTPPPPPRDVHTGRPISPRHPFPFPPQSGDSPSGLRSPSRVTFNVESILDQSTRLRDDIIDATLIRFEQISPDAKLPSIPKPPDIPDLPPVGDPYLDIVYPKSHNELLKLYVHGLGTSKPVPFIVVTHKPTLSQIQTYTTREGRIVVVRLKPYYNGDYTVELFENGAALPCSPFTINLVSKYFFEHKVETTETKTERLTEEVTKIIEQITEPYPREESRKSFFESEYGDSLWDADLVECDIINKKVENITIAAKSLRFYKESPATSTTFDVEFKVKEEVYEKISPEPIEDNIPPLIMSVELPKYPTVNVIDLHTSDELPVYVTKDDDSYVIEGQPCQPGHFKVDVIVDGDHITESPFYIEISKNEPNQVIFSSMKPASPTPDDIIMLTKKMRRKPKKKKKKIDPQIPFLDGKPIDPVHLPVPGLFKDPTPIMQMPVGGPEFIERTSSNTKNTTNTTESHTTKTTTTKSFSRTRKTVSSQQSSMSESNRSDYYNNKLCDFNDAKYALTSEMEDLKTLLENYLDAGMGADLSDTDDEREGYRYADQRRFIFLDEDSPYEIDVFSRETKSMEFGFKIKSAWCEDIMIFLINEQSQTFLKTRLEKLEHDDEFACFGRVHDEGRYILEIFHNDKRLYGRRFYLVARQALGAEGLDIWGPGFHGPVVYDVETWFNISFKRSGPGVLSCIYTDAEEEPISLNANEINPDEYHFKYTPTMLGPIEIDITFDEEDVDGIPKIIDCVPKPVLANGATKFDLFFHKLTEVKITVQDFRGENLEPQLVPIGSNEVSVTFVPQVPGDHKVFCNSKKNNKQIRGSPVSILIRDEQVQEQDILVYYAEDPFPPTMGYSSVTGSVTARQEYVFCKDPIEAEFTFTCKEAFIGMFRASIQNTETGQYVPNTVEQENENVRAIKIKCSKPGKHRIDLTVNDQLIPGCPLFFHCIEGLGAPGVRAYGQGYTGPHHEGILNVMTLNTGLAGPGLLEVLLRDKNGSISVDVKDTEDGKLLCAYTPGDAPVFMEIMFDKVHIPGSPRVVPPYEGFLTDSESETEDENDDMEEKDVNYFYLNENAEMELDYDGIGDLKVNIVNFENENITIKGRCTTIAASKYVITFKPKVKGLHMVEVFDGEFQLSNSPFFVTVLESRGKLAIEFYGPGIVGPLVLDRRTAFTVNTSGAGAGVLEVLIETEEDTVPVTVEDNFNKCITCYWTPTKWCDHTVSVLYNKEHVKGSPKVLKVYENDPKKKSLDDLDNGIVVKVPPKSFDNLFVEVEDPDSNLVESSFTKLGVDCIKVCFETPIHGIYLCNIFFHNVHIKGSPIEILVGDVSGGKPLVPSCGDGNYPRCLAPINVNEPSQIVLNAQFKLRPDVYILHEDSGTKVYAILKYEDYGKHMIIFTPTKIGGHVIDIQIKGVSIPGCPVTVQVVQPPGADGAVVDGLDNPDDGKDKNPFKPFDNLDEFGDFDDSGDGRSLEDAVLDLFQPGEFGAKRRREKKKVLKMEAGVKKRITVDTRQCGEGVLQVSIASNSGEVPVRIKQNADETYSVSFTPEADGMLKVSITFNGNDIPGSPYLAVVGKPRKNNIDFDRFQVYCYSPSGKVILSELYQVDGGNVKLKFKPENPGPYKVEIYNGADHIKGSPFVVHIEKDDISEEKNVFDIQESNVVMIGELQNKVVHSGDTLTILLSAHPAEDGILLKYIPTNETDRSWRLISLGETNLISWCAGRGGRYRFEITNRAGVLNSYLVDVIPVIDAGKCVVAGPAFNGNITVGDTTHFTVDCRESGNNTISVVINDDNGKIPILVEELKHFIWRCTLNPINMGDHVVALHLDKALYRERLLKFIVSKQSAGSCTLTDMSPPIASVGVLVRVVISLTVVTADDIIISIYNPVEELLECSAKTFDGINVHLEFIAESEGCHRINVCTRGIQLEGSPFLIDVQGENQGLAPPPLADKIINKLGNEVRVGDGDTVVSKNIMSTQVASAIRLAQQFDIDNLATKAAPVKSSLRKSREVRVESPAPKVTPVGTPHSDQLLSASKSETNSSESAVLVGDEVNFVIRNVSSTDYNININGPPGSNSYCYTNYDEENHTLSFKYVPEAAGSYSVRLFNKDMEIAESPIEFKVLPLPVPKIQLVVQGEGLSHGTVNNPAVFDVITASSGNLTVSIEGPHETKIHIQDRAGGGCRVSYYPTTAGEYLIHLAYAGVGIDGSPYRAVIKKATTEAVLPGPAAPPDKVYVKEPYLISLPTATNVKDLMISVGGPEGISTKVQSVREGGFPAISYVPLIPGKYQLIVKTSAGSVKGSPFNFTAVSKLLLECTCRGKALEGMKVRESGTLVVSYNMSNPGGISYEMTGPAKPVIQVSRRQNADVLSFNPRKPGAYQLYVKYNNKVLRQSPFTVKVVDLKHFNFLYLQDSLNSVQLGKNVAITLDISKCGPGRVLAELEGPLKIEPVKVENNLKTAVIRFKSTRPGNHKLALQYNNIPFPASPFSFHVPRKSGGRIGNMPVEGEGLKVALVNKANYIYVNNVPKGTGLQVEVLSAEQEAQEVRVITGTSGTSTIEYYVSSPGIYTVSLSWEGQLLAGCPYTVPAVLAE